MVFHIVTAPRPRDPNITLMQNGSTLPVSGRSRVLSQACGGRRGRSSWRSLCLGRSPIRTRSVASTLRIPFAAGHVEHPTSDHLAPLANAGVPLLHVCGSVDPWLESQTKVVQRVIRNLAVRSPSSSRKGDGHYPLAPRDPQPVVDFILRSCQKAMPPTTDRQETAMARTEG